MKKSNSKRKSDMIFILFSLVLGMLMGWVATDLMGKGIAGAIVTNIGVWVFVASLLAAYSQEAFRASLHVFIYFFGVTCAYHIHHVLLGGKTDVQSIVYWLILGAVGALMGFIVWNSRAKEWLGAACSAVPISFLLAEGYPIYHSLSVSLGFDIVCGVILYILLAPGKYQKLMALPFIMAFTFALVYFNVLSRIFGGWL